MALAGIQSSGYLPDHVTAVTFDDGFADIQEHAWPILLRHQIPCTIFLVAETLLRKEPFADWIDGTEPLRRPTLSLEQAREMRKLGVRFGSHSYAHQDLTTLSEYECELDLRESRQMLEDLLSTPIRFLAYPYGRYDKRVRRAAQRAGFTYAFAMGDPQPTFSPYAIPRAVIDYKTELFRTERESGAWSIPSDRGSYPSEPPR